MHGAVAILACGIIVSDFLDFSIYVDAPEHAARRWYIERFLLLRATAFKESASYFHRYAALSDEAAEQVAGEIWDAIAGPTAPQPDQGIGAPIQGVRTPWLATSP